MSSTKQAEYLYNLAIAYPSVATSAGFDVAPFLKVENPIRAIETSITGRIASQVIGKCVDYAEKNWEWRPTSRQSIAAELAFQYCVKNGYVILHRRLYDSVLNDARKIGFQGKFSPLLFSKNVNGQRIPLSNNEAEERFRSLLSAVKTEVNQRLAKGEKKLDQNQDQNQDQEREIDDLDEIEDLYGEEGIEQEQEEEKIPELTDEEINQERERERRRQIQELKIWIWNTGEWCDQRNADGHPIDSIGMRPFVDGAKMVSAGIPIDAIKYAMTMHWPDEARRANGVTEFDYADFNPDERVPGLHKVTPYALALTRMRIPVCLIGKSGTGKTTLAGNIAEKLGLPFGFVSMTRGTSPSAFNGRPRIADDGSMIRFMKAMADGDSKLATDIVKDVEKRGDIVVSQFVKIYGGGGVYLFDELDAGDENLLLLVNAALANGHFANPATGEIVEKHPDFMPFAGMNTMGMGATRDHNARNRLDHATLDRWRMGRVIVKLDQELAFEAFDNIIAANSL